MRVKLSGLYCIVLQEAFLALQSLLATKGASPFSCPTSKDFLLSIASSILISVAVTRKVKGTPKKRILLDL